MEIKAMVDKAIRDGTMIVVDLENKSMLIGRRLVIENNFPTDGFVLDFPKVSNEVALEELKDLYHKYKYSVPSERSGQRRKSYFPALSLDDLDDACFIHAFEREKQNVLLETSILFHSVMGNLQWEDRYGNWFYKDGDFIMMKSWF